MKSRANQVYATVSPPRGHCILPGLCGGMGKAAVRWHLGCSEVSHRHALSMKALQLMKQQCNHQWKFQNQKIGIIYSLKADTNYIFYSNTRHVPFKWNGSGILETLLLLPGDLDTLRRAGKKLCAYFRKKPYWSVGDRIICIGNTRT